MSIKVFLSDPTHKNSVEVDITEKEKRALVVATRSLKTFENETRFFTNGLQGIDMNIDASFGGTPVKILDGEDPTSLWTASAIAGSWDFVSTAQSKSGSGSVDATSTINNSVAQFAKGSSQSLAGHVGISGWIYITEWPTTGTKQVLLFGWDTGTISIVGISVDLADYVNVGTLNVWQKFSIPLSDLSLVGTTIDAIRIQTISTGGGQAPNYFLDDVQIEETGGSIIYTIEPDLGTWLHIECIHLIMADLFASEVLNGTVPGIPYDAFLGVSALSNGIIYQRLSGKDIRFSFGFKQLSDILQLPGSEIKSQGSDGTNTWLALDSQPTEPLILKSENGDLLRIIISDNLSGLLLLRISAGGKSEQRPLMFV